MSSLAVISERPRTWPSGRVAREPDDGGADRRKRGAATTHWAAGLFRTSSSVHS